MPTGVPIHALPVADVQLVMDVARDVVTQPLLVLTNLFHFFINHVDPRTMHGQLTFQVNDLFQGRARRGIDVTPRNEKFEILTAEILQCIGVH